MGETVPTAPPPLAPPVVVVAPSPKSPPKYPDLCGRRRLQLELQILNREVGFIEEELQSLEGIQPVSRCCKEVNDFVGTKPDPLIPINKRRHKSCCLWRWIRYYSTKTLPSSELLVSYPYEVLSPGQSCVSISHGFAASVSVALVHEAVPVVNVNVPALNAVRLLPADRAAAVQKFLASAAEHAATARSFPAVT
ncbi:hypothetical protein C4D60_Mb03t05870 [Musa balbisiana]|uniref:G protein gamma domain-containing protein n=1 Tax=Musa balbisiana TaxID=52838 RepID=A0A4S8J7Y0_MUSBA|nr:hypothetical protein C4D60_Mb03t05870 [Musa balbisiana]